jgi:hypothetical protein
VTQRLLVIAILGVTVVLPAAVTWKKGQRAAFWLGFVVPGPVWLVAASRLARPDSDWARRFYGHRKMERARRRFGDPRDATVSP